MRAWVIRNVFVLGDGLLFVIVLVEGHDGELVSWGRFERCRG